MYLNITIYLKYVPYFFLQPFLQVSKQQVRLIIMKIGKKNITRDQRKPTIERGFIKVTSHNNEQQSVSANSEVVNEQRFPPVDSVG